MVSLLSCSDLRSGHDQAGATGVLCVGISCARTDLSMVQVRDLKRGRTWFAWLRPGYPTIPFRGRLQKPQQRLSHVVANTTRAPANTLTRSVGEGRARKLAGRVGLTGRAAFGGALTARELFGKIWFLPQLVLSLILRRRESVAVHTLVLIARGLAWPERLRPCHW